LGFLKPGYISDVVVVAGDPSKNISAIRNVQFVMKEGVIYKQVK